MATSVAGLSPSHLYCILDRSSGPRFLVDTGAEVSVVPPTRAEKKHPQTSLHFQAVNNTLITTFGSLSSTVDVGL